MVDASNKYTGEKVGYGCIKQNFMNFGTHSFINPSQSRPRDQYRFQKSSKSNHSRERKKVSKPRTLLVIHLCIHTQRVRYIFTLCVQKSLLLK